MLTIKELKVTYGQEVVLDIQQELVFDVNDRIGIIGPNGAGKTTLIKAILGLVPYEGKIMTALTRGEMAVHLQENRYSTNVSVQLLLETIGRKKLKDNPALQGLIAYFDFAPCLRKRFDQLSGGQKQRLTLILVMLQEAPLTFYDEVSTGLDFETRQELMVKLTEWYEARQGIVCLVSHYYAELETLTNKLLVLDQGKVIAFGKAEDLFRVYCGYSVITLAKTAATLALFRGYRHLLAPEHVLALACHSQADERAIANVCLAHNLNFRRQNNDIEIMTLNAKAKEGDSNDATLP